MGYAVDWSKQKYEREKRERQKIKEKKDKKQPPLTKPRGSARCSSHNLPCDSHWPVLEAHIDAVCLSAIAPEIRELKAALHVAILNNDAAAVQCARYLLGLLKKERDDHFARFLCGSAC